MRSPQTTDAILRYDSLYTERNGLIRFGCFIAGDGAWVASPNDLPAAPERSTTARMTHWLSEKS